MVIVRLARPALAVLVLAAGLARAGDGPAPGTVVGPDTAAQAKDVLPPEILRKYEKGEYRNPVVAYPVGRRNWEKPWLEATADNAKRLALNDAGTIVERDSGKQPAVLYGIPFPEIDAKDPQAAAKIVWNQFLAYWSNGNTYNETLVLMLSPAGIERRIGANGWFKFWDGQAERYREPNPLNLQSQFLGVSTSPADLQGTASLTWRYRDPTKRDSVWAYVPALRRVRAVSPSNRSDGYLGSDISGDDGFFFDGKPEDFTWELVGKRDMLRIVDPRSVSGSLPVTPAKGGGWTTLTTDGPKYMLGADDPEWHGVAWAPLSASLARRPGWVIKATPKDRYYLYGSLELWIDAETWDGSWNRKFDWKGELTGGYSTLARVRHPTGPGEDAEWIGVNSQVWACGENYKLDRASCSGFRAHPDSPYVGRVPIPASTFDSQALVRFGK
jgi:hypothetical protein